MNASDAIERGRAALRNGQFDEAVALLTDPCTANPHNATLHFLLGAARHGGNDLDGALMAFNEAHQLAPDETETLNALVALHVHRGEPGKALKYCERALELAPNEPRNLTHLAQLLANDDPQRALRALNHALEQPGEPFAPLLARGIVLTKLGRVDEAIANNLRITERYPTHPMGFFNLSDAYLAARRFADALDATNQALALAPNHAGARFNQGVALSAQGEFVAGQDALVAALKADPTLIARLSGRLGFGLNASDVDARLIYIHSTLDRFATCDWSGLDDFLQTLERLLRETNHGEAALVDPALLFRTAFLPIAASLKGTLAASVSDHLTETVEATPRIWVDRTPREEGRRLRVGYIDAQVGDHPGSASCSRLFEHCDASQFEIYFYGLTVDAESAHTEVIKNAVAEFHDLSALSDEDAAFKLYQDELDVLVDLSGYTTNARPQLLAYRCAPLQLAFHGYHETYGASFIDYHIVDPIACPPEERDHRREQLILLDRPALCFDDQLKIDPILPTREEAGLPNDRFVFAGMHRSDKLDPTTFSVWLRILREVPDSVLWLLAYDANTTANLVDIATRNGIDARRLIFAPRQPREMHIARLPLADLHLDTLWYNAHTTALEVCWMGCPFLSVQGAGVYSRLGGSVLSYLGFPDLVFDDYDDYADAATSLAKNPVALSELRERFQQAKQSPVFRAAHAMAQIEAGVLEAWSRLQVGQPPGTIDLRALALRRS